MCVFTEIVVLTVNSVYADQMQHSLVFYHLGQHCMLYAKVPIMGNNLQQDL